MESDQANQLAEVSSEAQDPESTSGQAADAAHELQDQHQSNGSKGSASAPKSHADIARLESRLREKEQLVSALTERLEQAAEQLDRIHRTGGDRGLRTGGGGLPPELVQQQNDLVQQLKVAVDQWQEMQAAATLARVELGISEIRDLLTSGNLGDHSSFQQPAASRQERPKSSPSQPAANQPTPGSWEALKAGIFAAEGEGAGAAPPKPKRQEQPEVRQEQADIWRVQPDVPAIDAPEPVDIESASIEQLRAAVEQRDSYIANLTERLQIAEQFFGNTEGWKSLDSAPEDLRSRLEMLEAQLQDKLRQTEVKLSLERAQMGREQAKLQQQRELIDKELKRLGLSPGEDLAEASGAMHPDDDQQGSRWMRFLRKGE